MSNSCDTSPRRMRALIKRISSPNRSSARSVGFAVRNNILVGGRHARQIRAGTR